MSNYITYSSPTTFRSKFNPIIGLNPAFLQEFNDNFLYGIFLNLSQTLSIPQGNFEKRATKQTHQDTIKWTDNYTTEKKHEPVRLASCGVTCLNSSAVFQINFSAGLTVLCPEIPHERQAQKR
jgi:hypothetical protein